MRRRELSPVELTEAFLARIERHNPHLNAFITVLSEGARAAAERAEAEIARGHYRGPLHGIPIAHKDVLLTRSVRTTAHSRILVDHVPTVDATAVERLAQGGAILLGKLNTYEFACGATEQFGVPVNPWESSRTTGGSSAGSGAAVAAGLCLAATGTDTGGSVRSPAAYCGVVGLKPTYGRISRAGVLALSPSLDHVGTLTRTARDGAILLEALAGFDPRDHSSSSAPPPSGADLSAATAVSRVKGLRLGVPWALFGEPVTPEAATLAEAAVTELARLGATLHAVELPFVNLSAAALTGIMAPEATACHEPWLRRQAGAYGAFTRQKLLLGACVEAVDYLRAQQARHLLASRLQDVFREVDALVWPTTNRSAPPVAEPELPTGVQTRLTNLTGHPSLSIPCGHTGEGLPVGLQIIGRFYDEETILLLAAAYETVSDWTERRPELRQLTRPPSTKPYDKPERPGEANQREIEALEDTVVTALRRRRLPLLEEDLGPLVVGLYGFHNGLRDLDEAGIAEFEPLVHQHVTNLASVSQP